MKHLRFFYYSVSVFIITLLRVSALLRDDVGHTNFAMHGYSVISSNDYINDTMPIRNITHIQRLRHRVFIPFARPLRNDDNTTECSSSADDFPSFFTDKQVKSGWIVICILIGIYSFTLLAVVCDGYFLPCVETICEVLNLTPDVAAATFMSVATSCPELFTNIIGTFVTESDIGIGTIVGSSLFNGLGVAAIGGLAAPFPLQLDWWPLTRDCSIYICAVGMLILITWDGIIFWYESLVLFITYFIYFTIMFQNTRISKFVKSRFNKNKPTNEFQSNIALSGDDAPKMSIISAYGTYIDEAKIPGYETVHEEKLKELDEAGKVDAKKSLFRKFEGTKLQTFVFYYTWPIQLVLRCTIPNSKIYPKLFPVTLLCCIIWIGVNSYIVSWMMTIIGNCIGLPDSVLGMTFLAAGGCLPESISMVIISRRGEGAFGVSNSLGANTMNILFSLGMPWFFKNMANGATSARPVRIESGSIEYTIMALILVAVSLYSTLAFNKFKLSKVSGSILLCVYIILVVLAILSEMVFFDNKNC